MSQQEKFSKSDIELLEEERKLKEKVYQFDKSLLNTMISPKHETVDKEGKKVTYRLVKEMQNSTLKSNVIMLNLFHSEYTTQSYQLKTRPLRNGWNLNLGLEDW